MSNWEVKLRYRGLHQVMGMESVTGRWSSLCKYHECTQCTENRKQVCEARMKSKDLGEVREESGCERRQRTKR